MAVDNVALFGVEPEQRKQRSANLFFLRVLIVGVILFTLQGLVIQKIPFKKRHFIFAVKRRARAAPQVPKNVCGRLLLLARQKEICFVGRFIQLVKQRFAAVMRVFDADVLQLSVVGKGNTAVEQQIAVGHLIHGTVGIQKADMRVQPFAVQE